MVEARLSIPKAIAIGLILFVGAFDYGTYTSESTGNPLSVAVFDGVITVLVGVFAFSLWRVRRPSRAVKMTFASTVIFFFLWLFLIPFGSPLTEVVSPLLLFAAAISLITGFFMRKGA